MTIVYVSRDERDQIVGVFTSRQPGYAEEEIAENHPEILEYKEKRQARRTTVQKHKFLELENIKARLDRLEKLLNVPVNGRLDSKLENVKSRSVRVRKV